MEYFRRMVEIDPMLVEIRPILRRIPHSKNEAGGPLNDRPAIRRAFRGRPRTSDYIY